MIVKRVIRWTEPGGDAADGVVLTENAGGFVAIHTNADAQYTCAEFAPADFVAWVETEILPRYEKAKSLTK